MKKIDTILKHLDKNELSDASKKLEDYRLYTEHAQRNTSELAKMLNELLSKIDAITRLDTQDAAKARITRFTKTSELKKEVNDLRIKAEILSRNIDDLQ